MDSKPLISVIVPVHNVEKYLRKCVDSIINQTYKNLEIILVDDGSTDNSGIICDEYAQRDARVKVFHTENGGAAAARNVGLFCKGEYIGFVDSDDWIDKDMYEVLYDTCKKNNADAAQILSRRVSDDGTIYNQKLIDTTAGQGEITYETENAIVHYLTGNHSLWSHLYRATMFINVRLAGGIGCEDMEIIIPLYSNANKVVKVSKYLYNYRDNPTSLTNSKNKKIGHRLLNFYDAMEDQLIDYGDNPFYKELLTAFIVTKLQVLINRIILTSDLNKTMEKEYRNRLLHHIQNANDNRYLSERLKRKINLYLSHRHIYLLLLKLKRVFYKPVKYGEE